MTIVTTTAGRLQGTTHGDIHTFLGVPYAAPLDADRAFLAPQPRTPWTGIRSAQQHGSVCPQVATYGPVGQAATSSFAAGADCLTLNIRSRDLRASAPVLVWVHGGGYAAGSANEATLQTGAFAADGVVEVTVNYRLGVLGFLHLGGDYPDNRGLLDIIAALRWVRDNIAAFGGDPQRVTLAGRSAGGFAVAALLAMPDAQGLFQQALLQSGASTALATPEDARRVTQRMQSALGALHQPLPQVPWHLLLAAQQQICDESYQRHNAARDGAASMLGVPFTPVIDGASLPAHPEALAAAGALPPIPIMIGTTSAEYLTHSSVQPDMDDALAARLLDERVKPLGWRGADIVQRYRDALPHHSGRGLWRAIAGDLVFQHPSARFARLLAPRQPVYKYLYGDIAPDERGAAHGAELGHVWWRSGQPAPRLAAHQQILDEDFAAAIHQVWLSFLQHQPPRYLHQPWPTYRDAQGSVLHLSPLASDMTADPFAARLAWWKR